MWAGPKHPYPVVIYPSKLMCKRTVSKIHEKYFTFVSDEYEYIMIIGKTLIIILYILQSRFDHKGEEQSDLNIEHCPSRP